MPAATAMRGKAMARILDALAGADGLSKREIARASFVAESTLSGGGYLNALKAAGLIHISGWRKNANGFTTALYRRGAGTDCPQPRFADADRASPGLAEILSALERFGPLSCREAAALAGLSLHTVKNARYMDVLVAQGRAHVCAWRRNRRGPLCAIYAAGAGREVPKPPPLSAAEKSRNHRRRQAAARSPWAEQIIGLRGRGEAASPT